MVRTGLTHKSAAYVRKQATANMLQTCHVDHVVPPTVNNATLIATAGSRTPGYFGPCRLWETQGPSQVSLDQAEFLAYSIIWSIPWDTPSNLLPALHDEVEIDADPTDGSRVGQRYRIESYFKGGNLRATRSYIVSRIDKRP